MINVSRQSANAVNTELIYYLVQHYEQFLLLANNYDSRYYYNDNNDTQLPMTDASVTCELMSSVDRQQAAIILGYIVVSMCLGMYYHYYYYY